MRVTNPIPLALTALAVGAPLFVATPETPPMAETWKVIGWNDLGMHCMDADYSVFSILPPFNTIQCQVITPEGALLRDATGVEVTYESVMDPAGSINRTSAGKTNYWTHAPSLYGASSTPDTGLAGHDMPGLANTPQRMRFDAGRAVFAAEGIPITPFDDGLHERPYPMMRLVVRVNNVPVATTDIVLPVSDEMDCSACHTSGTQSAARPAAGWAFDRSHERDYRLNILRLHDDLQQTDPAFQAALKTAGYSDKGLYDTVTARGQPILCARCHGSNALPGTGIAGVSPLTAAVHARHAAVTDPDTQKRLGDSTNRQSCYRCHPGSETRCLRGAMGGAVAADGALAMSCQACHGQMDAVGSASRAGWLDEPSCQNCHTGTATRNSGQIRFTSALDSNGARRVPADRTFATNPDVPAQGFDLYRFSRGHGGLACEACHGSTHAVYPSIHPNDNVQSVQRQGHAGTLVRCDACHSETPDVGLEGPHGLHPVGDHWVDAHGDVAEKLGTGACRPCHGTDDRGSVLSLSHADQTFRTKFGTRAFFRGARVSCYACHDGPRSERTNPNRAPVAQDAATGTIDTPVNVPLQATDADNDPLTLRIVTQPRGGRVALSGTTAVYHPDPGFSGADTFTFAAWDGAIDSNLATVTVTRGAQLRAYGAGYPGTGGAVPVLASPQRPVLGSAMQFSISNPGGAPTAALILLSPERASIATVFGGQLLTEPQLQTLLPVSATGAVFSATVPNVQSLVGAILFAQVLVADPGARYGIAFSRGVEMALGR